MEPQDFDNSFNTSPWLPNHANFHFLKYWKFKDPYIMAYWFHVQKSIAGQTKI